MEKKISAERAQKRAKEAKTAIMKTSRNELEKKVMDFEHEMEELSAAQSKAIAAAVEAELKDLKAQTHEEKANAQRFKDLAEKWESRAGKWKAKYDEAAQSVAKYKTLASSYSSSSRSHHGRRRGTVRSPSPSESPSPRPARKHRRRERSLDRSDSEADCEKICNSVESSPFKKVSCSYLSIHIFRTIAILNMVNFTGIFTKKKKLAPPGFEPALSPKAPHLVTTNCQLDRRSRRPTIHEFYMYINFTWRTFICKIRVKNFFF
eukprot:g14196.t1